MFFNSIFRYFFPKTSQNNWLNSDLNEPILDSHKTIYFSENENQDDKELNILNFFDNRPTLYKFILFLLPIVIVIDYTSPYQNNPIWRYCFIPIYLGIILFGAFVQAGTIEKWKSKEIITENQSVTMNILLGNWSEVVSVAFAIIGNQYFIIFLVSLGSMLANLLLVIPAVLSVLYFIGEQKAILSYKDIKSALKDLLQLMISIIIYILICYFVDNKMASHILVGLSVVEIFYYIRYQSGIY